MRTEQEIVERIRERAKEDLFGFEISALVVWLPFDKAREFLKDEAKESEWSYKPCTDDAVRRKVLGYLPFAWDKALNHRGISAGRSISHMTAWLWLLGETELCAVCEDGEKHYTPYGAPILKMISDKFGFVIPDDPMAVRMSQGLACSDDCDGRNG
jgi:hypothetical protein